jgi:hypothetical protein
MVLATFAPFVDSIDLKRISIKIIKVVGENPQGVRDTSPKKIKMMMGIMLT